MTFRKAGIIGEADRIGDQQPRAVFRDVANGAIENAQAVGVDDLALLEDAPARNLSFVVHGSPDEVRGTTARTMPANCLGNPYCDSGLIIYVAGTPHAP
jgi:hypothetical protein